MFVVLEGIDGAGKSTLTALVRTLAQRCGLRITTLSFPRYGANPFSQMIGKYLNGDFGAVNQVAPQLAALLYAGDRFVTREELLTACRTHDLVLCDRYVASNLAHQAAKLAPTARGEFIAWLRAIEYDVYKLPLPELQIFLDMPVPFAQQLGLRKAQRPYTALQADIHERDAQYLQACREVYQQLVAAHDTGPWVTIACTTTDGHLRPPVELSQEIWQYIQPHGPSTT